MRGTVLVVDDHARPRRALATELEDAGFAVIEAADGAEAWERFCRHTPDVVITDMVMPRSDGLDLLSRVRSRSEVPVILFTARGSVESVASAFKAGADDFVASPDVEVEDLVKLVASAMGQGPAPALPDLEARLVGKSAAMTRIRERIAGLAPLGTPVLVSGEPGTGRDTVAVALHELGATAGGELVRIDAGSFSPPGHIPDSGTVYLEGVEDLSSEAQSYWAERVAEAEARGFRGGTRILASTSEPLRSRMEEGGFHLGLGSALLRFQVELPALRDRREDVPAIAKALVERIARSVGRSRIRLSAPALDFLTTRRWPGNIRQLERLLEHAIAFSRGRVIRLEVVKEVLAELDDSLASIRDQYGALEREALLRAIQATGGNVSQTAWLLGKSRSAIYRLLQKHGVRLKRGD